MPGPDLLLLDMHLPKYDGEEILKRLRSTEHYAQIPVVVMTSSDAPHDHDRAQKHAAMFYFRKPSRLDEFIQLGVIVREILTGKKALYDRRSGAGGTRRCGMTPTRTIRKEEIPVNGAATGHAKALAAAPGDALLRELQALRRSEAVLRDFVETSTIGLHWVGADGAILWANQAELNLLGYTREEYIGRNIAEFHVDEAIINDILACLSRGETLSDYPARLRHRDGSLRHVLINSSVLFEDGKFVHTRCFTRDITDLKQEQEARQAQLAAELADMKLLQDISAQLIEQGDEGPSTENCGRRCFHHAFGLRDHADSLSRAGSEGELRLLTSRGLTPEGEKTWEWVRQDTRSTCGEALRTGKRAIASNVETCDFLAGTAGHDGSARCRHWRRSVDAAIFAKRKNARHDLVALVQATQARSARACSTFWRESGRPHRADAGGGGLARKRAPAA